MYTRLEKLMNDISNTQSLQRVNGLTDVVGASYLQRCELQLSILDIDGIDSPLYKQLVDPCHTLVDDGLRSIGYDELLELIEGVFNL